MMKKYFLIIFMLLSSNANACGSTIDSFRKYTRCESLKCKLHFFKWNTCSLAINYVPLDADPLIVEVLIDAFESGIDKEKIVEVLDHNNCAFTAREIPEYSKLIEFIGENAYEEMCSQDRLDSLYLVNANGGAILRSEASSDAERLGAIIEGRYVEAIDESGDWVHVKSYDGEGYIYKALLTPY